MFHWVFSLTLFSCLLALAGCGLPFELPFKEPPAPTAIPLPSPSPTLAPSPTPVPTPVPTLAPAVRIENAEQALFYGDYEKALSAFISAFESAPPPEEAAAALLGIGKTQWIRGNTREALSTLEKLVDEYPGSSILPEAHYFIGRVLADLVRYDEAALAYQRHLELQPGVLDAYIQQLRGEALLAAGRPLEAVTAFNTALNSPQLPGSEETLRIRIADAYAVGGDATTALALYTEIAAGTTNDFTRAAMALKRGEMLAALGEADQAFELYRESIARFPRAYDAYIALLRLLDAGQEVDELQRGLVDYYAGEYSLAVFAFDRYLISAPDDHTGIAHYFKALSLRAIDAYPEAIAEWQDLIQTHEASDPYWDDAWEQIADTQWAFQDQIEDGMQTYLTFVARFPEHGRAPEFLYFAAQIAERSGQLLRAAELWERVDLEYPLFDRAYQARFLAGVTRYRIGSFEPALQNFQIAAQKLPGLFERSQAGFWIGKTLLALGRLDDAREAFEQTARLDPTGYYSERAADVLLDRTPFAYPDNFTLDVDQEAEREFAEGWMRLSFSLPEEVDLRAPGPLVQDARFLRGTAFWRLGEYERARGEFESLRQDIQSNARLNFLLADYLEEIGMYRTAIFSARRVLDLAGMDDASSLNAPPWFNRIRFGTYYRELVLPEAESKNVHPLLVYAVMRQESLFEGYVRSSAGARGLMQIIPQTGAGIAQNMGWPPDYTAEDLYRPLVSVRFGVGYLSQQRDFFVAGGEEQALHLYAALAAYNGGPGNAAAWLALAQGDPDLYLEVVRFEETRRYIRAVYELFSIYREIYSVEPAP